MDTAQVSALVQSLTKNVSSIVVELGQNATVLVTGMLETLKNLKREDAQGNATAMAQVFMTRVNETFTLLQNETYVTEKLTVAGQRIKTMDPNLIIAYSALLLMACLPIVFGSLGSLKFKKKKAHSDSDADDESEKRDETEFFSLEEAKMFPIYGSITLFSLYLLFRYFDKEYINYLLTAYFAVLGVGSVAKAVLSVMRTVSGLELKGDYRLQMFHKSNEVFLFNFGALHLTVLTASLLATVYYVLTKHWIVSNILGESFSITAIQLLNLDSFGTGIVLLAALFLYDIFWVFGTDVMVTVAKNFDAPIKVIWPKDFWALVGSGILNKPPTGTSFTMLGLGDIVVPGIYVCLCLQFDYHRYLKTNKGKKHPRTFFFPKPYFYSVFVFYILGLVTTVMVMHGFQSAQPALLYLSPACIFSSLFVALIRGEMTELFKFVPDGANDAREQKKKENLKAAAPEKKKSPKKEATNNSDATDGVGESGSTPLTKRKGRKPT